MSNTNTIPTSTVVAGNTMVLMAYVCNVDGEPITQADVDGITVDLYDVSVEGTRTAVDLDGAELGSSTEHADEPDVTDVVYDTPQTDSRWTMTSTGYNLAYTLVAPLVDHTYEVRITVTTTAGHTLVIPRTLVSK